MLYNEVMALKGSECEGCRVGENVGLGTIWVSTPYLLLHLWAHVSPMEVLAADTGVEPHVTADCH